MNLKRWDLVGFFDDRFVDIKIGFLHGVSLKKWVAFFGGVGVSKEK